MSDPSPLAPIHIAALVRASGDAAVAEIRALGDRSRIPPAPGEWSACEVLGHLIEADRRGFIGRMRLAVHEDRPTFEPWDQPSVAAARRDQERELEGLVAEFRAVRDDSLGFVASLDEADCARLGLHPHVGELSVSDLLHEWVHHDREHLAQMLAVSQSLVWPAMGNAQRFAELEG